jgi:hypothetical protein
MTTAKGGGFLRFNKNSRFITPKLSLKRRP